MTAIGDTVKYYHGRDDNHFHEGCESHEARVALIDADEVADMGILNADGNPTIPVSSVRRYADPQRQPYTAFWEPLGAKLPEPIWPPEPVVEPVVEVIAEASPVESAPSFTLRQKGKKK